MRTDATSQASSRVAWASNILPVSHAGPTDKQVCPCHPANHPANRIVSIAESCYERIVRHARTEFPHECCGILIGDVSPDATVVRRVATATNIAEGDPCHTYQIDWQSLFETVRATRKSSDRIVGFYHSHPDGSARPSRRDLESAWVDHAYLIVSTRGTSKPSVTAWRVTPGNGTFVEETVRLAKLPAPRESVLTG